MISGAPVTTLSSFGVGITSPEPVSGAPVTTLGSFQVGIMVPTPFSGAPATVLSSFQVFIASETLDGSVPEASFMDEDILINSPFGGYGGILSPLSIH